MHSGTDLLQNGPLVLLENIAAACPKGSGVDVRAQVTIHTRDGKTWIGVPTRFIPTRDEKYIVLEAHTKKSIVCLNISSIAAVEIENLDFVVSYLEQPWKRDSRFHNVSRLQLLREIETLWKFIPTQNLKLDLTQFPTSEDTPGTLLAWVEMLKQELDTIMSTSVGAEAIKEIQNISITYGGQGIELKKQDKDLIFKLSLDKRSFDRAQIAQLLNDSL